MRPASAASRGFAEQQAVERHDRIGAESQLARPPDRASLGLGQPQHIGFGLFVRQRLFIDIGGPRAEGNPRDPQ